MGYVLVRNVVLMLVFITLAMEAANSEEDLPVSWTMHIGNKMLDGGVLLVHCKSKDKDIGAHNVTYAQEIEFAIEENFWGTTLYWCYFRSMQGHAEFNIFWPEKRHYWLRAHCGGGNCVWTAKDDGIFLRNNPENTDDYKHDWIDTSF